MRSETANGRESCPARAGVMALARPCPCAFARPCALARPQALRLHTRVPEDLSPVGGVARVVAGSGRGCVAVVAVLAAAWLAGCTGGNDADVAPEAVDEFMVEGFVLTMALVPIPGATVALDPRGFAATTDSDGGFSLGPLAAGPHRLLIEAKGYADRSEIITIGPNLELMYIKLDAVSRDVPYSEVQKFIGYVECSYAAHAGPIPLGNFGCTNAADLILGTDFNNDDDVFPIQLGGPGFKGVMVEMYWEEQATGSYWSGYLRSVPDTVGGVNLEHQYWSTGSPNPIQALIVAGVENSGAYSGDVFHPDENDTITYELHHAGTWDNSEPVDVSIMLRVTVEIFVTTFYYKLPGEGYTALDCEGCG